jgi:hypothetical protein
MRKRSTRYGYLSPDERLHAVRDARAVLHAAYEERVLNGFSDLAPQIESGAVRDGAELQTCVEQYVAAALLLWPRDVVFETVQYAPTTSIDLDALRTRASSAVAADLVSRLRPVLDRRRGPAAPAESQAPEPPIATSPREVQSAASARRRRRRGP